MNLDQQVIAMAAFIQMGIIAVVKGMHMMWMADKKQCRDDISRMEMKLDEGAEAMKQLAAALQKQVDAHELTIERLTRSEGRER
jgi:low affinity Fe/Cu permease